MYTSFEELKNDCQGCTKCGLHATRTNVVFGTGNEKAKIMFVGEGPGENEDLTGQPFVGRGGKLLDKYLNSIGLARNKNVYIANIVKCRPPENRDPKPEEQEQCIPWLREQFRLIKPKLVVCLGRIAACRLISPDYKVTSQHGQIVMKSGTAFMGTFHPAALLRNPNNKEAALQDFIEIRKFIEKNLDMEL